MIFNKLLGLKQGFKGFIELLFLNVILYSLLRIFFYIWNYNQLKSLSGLDLLRALVTGIRFDLAVVGPICGLLIMVWLWTPKIPRYFLSFLILLGHSFLILLSIADAVVVNFMGRRFTINSLYLIGEGKTSNWLEFWPLFVFAAMILAAYFYFIFKKMRGEIHLTFKARSLTTFGILILLVIFGRGGMQEKPISFINAKVIPHPFAHQLILNSGFTFVKSIGRDQIEHVHYFEKEEMLSYLNLSPPLYTKNRIQPQQLNVVLILVESLSSEYINSKVTPFFTELSSQGVLFNPAYANGRRSVEGIAAVLSGIPALMEESFVNSEFATNDFVGLGTLLKTMDYHTSFFHGGQNGTMRFDSFTKAAGFDHYYGKNEFNDNTQDDGAWGIYDEPFLRYTCAQLSNFPQPFATTIFTLSSHIPYHLPADFKPRVEVSDLKQEPDIIKSIHYTDYALQNFFQCAKKQAWFQNTLFIILADHTGPDLKSDSSFKAKFEIPILFYTSDRAKLQGLSNQQLAQQIDLLPTLTDLIGIPLLAKNHLARSLYEPGQKTVALFSDQRYELVTDVAQDPQRHEERLKAIRQYFSEGLYDNRLYYPPGK